MMPGPQKLAGAWRREPLTAFERRVHSQFGEDGVTSEVVRRVQPPVQTCVEIGAYTGAISNCAWLIERGWQAALIEASDSHFTELERRYRGHPRVTTTHATVTQDNVNEILEAAGCSLGVGLISIDVDGNDLWIWKALQLVRPEVVIIEYNRMLGPDRALVQPPLHQAWDGSAWFGASLAALELVAGRKGYQLVHTTSQGVNAFFVSTEYGHLFPEAAHVPRHTDAEPAADPEAAGFLELDADAAGS